MELFFTIFCKEDKFCDLLLVLGHTDSTEKESTFKEPLGANSFLLKLITFRMGDKTILMELHP